MFNIRGRRSNTLNMRLLLSLKVTIVKRVNSKILNKYAF